MLAPRACLRRAARRWLSSLAYGGRGKMMDKAKQQDIGPFRRLRRAPGSGAVAGPMGLRKENGTPPSLRILTTPPGRSAEGTLAYLSPAACRFPWHHGYPAQVCAHQRTTTTAAG